MRESIVRWTCDYCHVQHNTEAYHLPEGWRWVAGTPLKHTCSSCEVRIPEHQKGVSGSLHTIKN
jgi:hypothetical protein